MDEVFKAINDPSRRRLLDSLYENDGQTLSALVELLPDMTRFGVMNHLSVLEQAQLITTRKQGRTKLHYLNPVPIRLIHDRWINKYTAPLVGTIAGLTSQLEGGNTMQQPVHIYQTFINAPVDRVWEALTDGDQTAQYYYGTHVTSEWEAGSRVAYNYEDGTVAADGEIVAIDPPNRLELTFHPRWDATLEAEGPSRHVWRLAEDDGVTQLTVELYDVAADSATYAEFTGGFAYIVSGLKTLLETGAPLARTR